MRNPTRRTLRVALADELAPSLRADTRPGRGPGPGAAASLRATTADPPRPAGPVHARPSWSCGSTGPLGLARPPGRRWSVPGLLRVYPSFRSKDEAELRIRKARILEVGLRSAQGLGGGTEFDQLREYTVDDEFRRVDWAATARAGRPIVRTYRAERNQTVLVLLDNGRVMAGRVDGVPRVEHAVDAVMMLTAVATGLGDRCGVVAFDREVRAAVAAGQRTRAARAGWSRPSTTSSPCWPRATTRAAFTETLARFRRRTLLVVLTDLVAPAVDEWLVPALPLIAARAPRGGGRRARPRRGPLGGRRRVRRRRAPTARPRPSSALDARRRTVARLRGLGATVVDAQPGRAGPGPRRRLPEGQGDRPPLTTVGDVAFRTGRRSNGPG